MRFPRSWLAAAGVLLAAAACTSGGSSAGSPTVSPTSGPPQTAQSGRPPATPSPDGAALGYFDNPVTIGVKYDQPGFSFQKGTSFAGFDIDLATYLATQLHFAPNSYTPVNDMDRSVVLGKTAKLVIATFSITQAREDGLDGQGPAIDFAGPYLVTPDAMLVKAGGEYAYPDPQVDKATICTLQGSTTQPGAVPLPKTTIVVDSATDYTQCVQWLEAGTVGAVFTDELVLDGYADEPAQYPGLVVEPTQYGSIQQYGIGVPRGQSAACKALIPVIQSFINSRTWQTDFKNDFPELVATDRTYQQDYQPDVNSVPSTSYCG